MRSTSQFVKPASLAAALIGLVVLAGCSGGDPSYSELLDDIPVDTSEYELTQQCVVNDGVVTLEGSLTNTSDRDRGYRMRYRYTRADGTAGDAVHEGDNAEPGETFDVAVPLIAVDNSISPPDCYVEVFISALEGLD